MRLVTTNWSQAREAVDYALLNSLTTKRLPPIVAQAIFPPFSFPSSISAYPSGGPWKSLKFFLEGRPYRIGDKFPTIRRGELGELTLIPFSDNLPLAPFTP